MRHRTTPNINTYGDLLPEWKHKLIIQRARARGVPPEDLAEVQQEVILAVLGYEHDPSKGATEKSALYLVIDRQITMYQRSHARRLGLHERYCADQGIADTEPTVPSGQSNHELHMDLQALIGQLSPIEQAVCAGLADGHPVSGLVTRLGVSRYEVDQTIGRIQDRFRKAGLAPGSRA